MGQAGSAPRGKDAVAVANFIERCRIRGIKGVVFDMDQCFVAKHSRGRLKRDELPGFVQAVTPAFRLLVPALVEAGFRLAIATHSDGIEFTEEKPRSTHIIGKELADAVSGLSICPFI